MVYKIKNPVIQGFSPDPSILRVGNDYYIATSTFHWNPGIQIFHSKDLANWHLLTHVLDEAADIDLRGTDTPAGIWAPHLSFDINSSQYWVAFSKMNNMNGRMFDADNFAVHASSIMGPWSAPIYLNSVGFDPSLFHDDDGRHYVVTLEWETREGYEHPGAIVLDEFDPTQNELIGESIRISRGGTDRGCLEAPHLYKHNGWYYLMTAEGGTGYGHGVVMQRSRNIEGPYESDPLNPIVTSTPYYYFRRGDPDALRSDLYNEDAPLQKAGHGSLVDTPNGEWYIAHLCSRPIPGTLDSTLGRETAIQKVEWTSDDWVRMTDGSTLAKDETPGITGIIPDSDYNDIGIVDEFHKKNIDNHFLTPYGTQNNSWLDLQSHPGWLRMKGRQSFYSQFDVSILAARVDAFKVSIETKLNFQPTHFSDSAGLILYYDNSNWIFARMTYDEINDGSVLDIVQAEQGDKKELLRTKIPIAGKEIKFKVTINYDKAQFFYQKHLEKWVKLGTELDIKYMSDEEIDGFTGLMAGIGTWDAYRRKSYAEFDYFRLIHGK